MIECLICNEKFTTKQINWHIKNIHKMSTKDYYDKYLKSENEGICPICSKETHFYGIIYGYNKNCSRACSNKSKNHTNSVAKTKFERYGNPGYNNPDKISKVLSSRTDDQWKESDLKDKATRQKHYGNATYNNQRKRMSTMKSNKTIKMSKDEKIIFDMLSTKFLNVEYSYYDEKRYPYNCDFYIKDLDLFIELNFSWVHGFHKYGIDITDNETLAKWQNKSISSNYYKKAIYVWTIDDINKFNTAKESNINYLVFYNMKQFNQWFNSL